ncbi:hypothetical protein M5K25_023324 [Dendrobium thyrsiflorum]|uniref:Uncharacterized protein n=1 Tax=Dendrobium thyrsiflorum TaxID=117978 RepID=A0ABD0UEL8_DENTH
MMFLLRNTHPVAPDLSSISEKKLPKDARTPPKPAATLEGLIAEDPFPIENGDKDSDLSCESTVTTSKYLNEYGNHSDVAEDEGWITIPKSKVCDDWFRASNVQQLHSLDRSFVFSGEQLHLLVCLSTTKHDEEAITPFIVSGVMSKNENSTQFTKHQNEVSCSTSSVRGQVNDNDMLTINAGPSECKDQTLSPSDMGPEQDVTVTKSLLQKEEHKLRLETLLEKFRCSNFFVRIAESDEPLWSKRFPVESSSTKSEMAGGIFHAKDGAPRKESCNFLSAIIDQGSFDFSASGGVARDVRCYSLSSGDIVVLLQVNVAVGNVKDPVLEVLQFEKYGAFVPDAENLSDLHSSNHYDPCGELLNWLLPLNRTLSPPQSLLPPLGQDQTVATHRSTSSYSGSQIFSFGQFRSYSMSSLPKDSAPSISATHNSRPSFDLEDLDCFTPERSKNHDMENEGLFSFRGVSLVPERFSVHCGFEGIYLPGRRWRRKIEIVQPLEIHSFAASCTTEDLLCVQIKNVSPAHLPDITIFLDAITIIYDEPSKGSPPFYLPLSSIETGGGHNLPNLPLRRGEEHSLILKPVTKLGGNLNGHGKANSTVPKVGKTTLGSASKASYLKKISPSTDQYAVLVSCRSNYTESKLFFKQRTSWRPHIAKDFIISVVSEISDQTIGSTRLPQLPVQVLTLHASNLTSEDLTLTVLAPLSSASSSSVVPLSSSPRNHTNTRASFPEIIGREAGDKNAGNMQRMSFMPAVAEKHDVNDANGEGSISLAQRIGATSDCLPSTDRGCTHLWLQSAVPLGVVPAHSSTSVKLELLPLTDGIITLDTLQVAVRDKGVTYVPEQPLKIYATSSIATGIA